MELGGFVSTGFKLSFEAVVLVVLLPLVLHEEIKMAAPAKTKTIGLIMMYGLEMNVSKLGGGGVMKIKICNTLTLKLQRAVH